MGLFVDGAYEKYDQADEAFCVYHANSMPYVFFERLDSSPEPFNIV
jgi:hypothetical protein